MQILILFSYSALFKNEIRGHIQTHLPDNIRQKFYCEQCKYETVSDERMKRHVKNEHGAEPKKEIQCVCHCGKVFQSLGRLNSHKKYTHLNEKNHICTICGKAFQSPSILKVCYYFCTKMSNLFIYFHYLLDAYGISYWETRCKL